MENNLFIRLIAKLNKALSKKQIQSDVKELQNTPFYIRLIGKLKIGDTRKQLRQDLNQVGQDTTIKVKANIDQKSLKNSYDIARRGLQDSSNNPINVRIDADTTKITNGLANVRQAQENVVNQDSGLKKLIQSYLSWYRIIDLIIGAIKKVVSTTADLAKAQNDLQIITGKSNSEMKSLMKNYNKLAKDLSSTTIQVAEGADEWLRTGENIKNTETLLRDSLVLSKIAKMNESDATKYLISSMRGYKVEAEDAISIVDKLAAVDMKSASSAAGLAESLSKTANVAKTSGVELDELIGYIATVSDITQDSAESVGNAFKSIFSRINNIKIGNFLDTESGEDFSEDINDAERVLSHFGLSLRKEALEFKDASQIIKEVAEIWNDATSVEKAAIKKAFGSTYQSEKVAALFENYTKAIELSEIAANSAGTAYQKFEVYENSLEAATNRLTASFESLAYNTVSEDFLKSLANSTAQIVEFVDKTQLLSTGLTALAFTGTIKGLLLLGTKIVSVKNNVVNMSAAMALSTNAANLNEQELKSLGMAYTSLTQKQQQLILSNKKLTAEQRIAILQATGLSKAEAELKLQEMGLIATTEAAASATFSLRGTWEALKLSILSNPIGLIITALTGVVTIIQQVNQKQEEIRQKAKEVADANNEEISSLKDLRKQYLEIINSSKSLSEKDAELAEWKETLASKYDIEIDKLKELNYERKIALGLIDEEILKQAKQTFANAEYKKKYDAFLKEYYNADYGNTSAVTHATQQAHIKAKIDNDDFKAISDYLKKEFGIYTKATQGIDTSLGLFGSTYSLEIEVNTDEKSLEEAMDVYADALNTINNKKEYFQKEFDQETDRQNKKDLKEKLESWQHYGDAIQDAYNRLEKIKNEYESYKSGIAQDALLRFDDFKNQSENSVNAIKTEQDAIKWVNKLIKEKSDNIDALAEELRELAIDELPDFKDAILGVGKETDNNTLSVKKLTDAYEDLSEVLDDLLSKQDKLADLYEKIAKGTELSASEAYKLIDEFPELTNYLVRVGSKWSFDIKGVNSAFDKLEDDFAQKTQEVIDNNKKVIEQSFEDYYAENTKLNFDKYLEENGVDPGDTDSLDYRTALFEYNNALAKERNEILEAYEKRQEAANDALKNAIALQQLLNNQINDFDFDVDYYNDKIKELMDASEKIAEGEALSYDELISLIDKFPDLTYSGENGEYFIEKSALDELIEKSYEERNARIDDEIAKTYAVNEEAANRIKAYEDEKEHIENALEENRKKHDESYDNPDLTEGILERIELTAEQSKLINELNALDKKQYEADKSLMESQSKYSEAYRKYLEALKGKLTSGSKSNSLSKELQNEIDYYDTIIKAIEAVTDKQIKALEDEKDALEKQKDALKDANDERQRELDLIKARNNLENAKKRKVYVYTEGYGFQQTLDKSAVKEAEEKLRDAELDIQEANIDKQIDKLDEQINAFEDYKKQFTDMKSDIEDLIAIEKAKNALDLDEQGLLNLPPETAKEIQEGLAEAVLKKDKEDNKDNKEYDKFGDVAFEDFLKKLGTPLSSDEIYKKWTESMLSSFTSPPELLRSVAENISNSSEVYNNNSKKEVTFAPNINVYGVSNPEEVKKTVKDELTEFFRQFRDSVI